VTDGDGVAVAGKDDPRVLGAFAVRDLHRVGGEEVRMASELRGAGLEGVPRARGFVEKHQEDGLIGQVAVGHAPFELPLQVPCDVDHDVQLGVSPLFGGDPVSALEKGLSETGGFSRHR